MVVVVSSFLALLIFAFGLGLGTTSNTKTHTGSEAVRESQRTNRNEGKTGGGSQQQQDKKGGPGEAARTGGGSSTRRRAHAASGVLRGHLDHPKVNTSVQEGHRNNTRNMV